MTWMACSSPPPSQDSRERTEARAAGQKMGAAPKFDEDKVSQDEDEPGAVKIKAKPKPMHQEIVDGQAQIEASEQCRTLLASWIAEGTAAERDLANCEFQKYNEHCVKAGRARIPILAKNSPCRKLKEAEGLDAKIPEVKCEIVKVPDQCGK